MLASLLGEKKTKRKERTEMDGKNIQHSISKEEKERPTSNVQHPILNEEKQMWIMGLMGPMCLGSPSEGSGTFNQIAVCFFCLVTKSQAHPSHWSHLSHLLNPLDQWWWMVLVMGQKATTS
jgi:hypothetical protein